MANVLQNNITHTYNGQELTSELFYEPEEMVPAISESFRVMNVISKKNIYIPNDLRKVLRQYTTCGFTATGGTANIDDKTIATCKIKANLEECSDVWDDTIFEEMLKTGVNIDDLSNTIIDDIIRRQVLGGIKSDIFRIVWFGDDDDADADWNQCDGFFTHFLDASATIGAPCFKVFVNEAAGVLGADDARDELRDMWDEADPTLLQAPNKVFYVSRTVINNLMTTYEDTQSALGLTKLIDGQGTERLSFRGVPVEVQPEWDVNLADAGNPYNATIGSNLIVFTTRDNLIVGTDSFSPENEMKIRYADDDDEKVKIVVKFKLGTQFVHEKLVCVRF